MYQLCTILWLTHISKYGVGSGEMMKYYFCITTVLAFEFNAYMLLFSLVDPNGAVAARTINPIQPGNCAYTVYAK